MKYAFTANEKNILRKKRHAATWYLALHRPTSVLSGTIASTPQTFPMSAVNVSLTGGAFTSVAKDMTMRVGTTPNGSQRGIIRVREAISSSATSTIQIAEAGCGLINFKQGEYVTVMGQYLPWPIHSKYNTSASEWRVDIDEEHTDELINYGPLVTMGPPFAGIADGNGVFTASFVGGSTQFVGAASNTALWEWLAIASSTDHQRLGTEDDPIGVTFGSAVTPLYQTGKYYTMITSDQNGNTHFGRRLGFIFQDRTQPYRVEFGEIAGGIEQGGYTTELRVTSNTASQFENLSEVVIFEEASYGDTASSIGGNYPFRSNIVMRGWILGDTVRINPYSGDVTFRIATIDGMLDQTDSYDIFMHDRPTISEEDWISAASFTIDKVAYNLVKHRSTIATLTDFNLAGGIADTEDLILYQDLPRASLWEQLRLNYGEKGIKGYVAADMQSNIHAFEDTQITGGSNNIAEVMSISHADRRDQMVIDEEFIPRISEAQMYSVASDSPYGAMIPGNVIGYFGKRIEHGRGLFVDQDTLVKWVGNWWAKLNNEHRRIIVPLSGNIRIDSVPLSRVSLSTSAIDSPKQVVWNNKQFLPKSTTLSYDNITGNVFSSIEMESIVDGAPGSAITFPGAIDNTDIPPPPPPPPPPEPEPDGQGDGFGTVYVVDDTTINRTRDFSATPPSWSDISGTVAGTLYDFILDPFAPTTTGYVVGTQGLYKSTNLNVSSPAWTQMVSLADVQAATGSAENIAQTGRVLGSINQQDYLAWIFALGDSSSAVGGIWCAVSEDGGSTWNYTLILGSQSFLVWGGAADIVPHVVNGSLTLFMSLGFRASSTNRPNQIRKSTDKGYTWSTVSTITNSGVNGQDTTICIHCPYDDNESGNIVYASVNRVSSDATFRSTDGGANWTNIVSGSTTAKRYGIESWTQDRQQMFFIQGSTTDTVLTSSDAGDNWTQVGSLPSSRNARSAGGFPYNSGLLYVLTESGGANAVLVSVDGGVTFVDKTGSLTLTISDSRRGTIVPVWIDES